MARDSLYCLRRMDAGSPTTSDGRKEQTDKIVRACAEACGVEHGLVEKIGSASEEQERRMDHPVRTGSLVVKIVCSNNSRPYNNNARSNRKCQNRNNNDSRAGLSTASATATVAY